MPLTTDPQGGGTIHRFREWFLADFWEGASIVTLFLVFPLVQVLSPRSAPLFLALSAIPIIVGQLVQKKRSLVEFQKERLRIAFLGHRFLIISVTTFLAWMLIQSTRSPQPLLALRDVLYIVSAFGLCLIILHGQSRPDAQKFAWILVSGIGLSGLFLISEFGGFTRYHWVPRLLYYHDLNRNAALLALLIPILPLICAKSFQVKATLAVVAVIAAIAIFSSSSQSAQMAIVSGLLSGLVIYLSQNTRRVIFLLMALLIIVTPWLVAPLHSLDERYSNRFLAEAHLSQRLTLWEDYGRLIPRKPLFGWGARADRALGLDNERVRALGHKINHGGAYPHNMAIEVWVNLGAVGAVLLALIIFLCGEAIGKLGRRGMIVASQMFTAGFVFSMFHSTVLQTWWMATVCIAAIAFSVLYRHRIKSPDAD